MIKILHELICKNNFVRTSLKNFLVRTSLYELFCKNWLYTNHAYFSLQWYFWIEKKQMKRGGNNHWCHRSSCITQPYDNRQIVSVHCCEKMSNKINGDRLELVKRKEKLSPKDLIWFSINNRHDLSTSISSYKNLQRWFIFIKFSIIGPFGFTKLAHNELLCG